MKTYGEASLLADYDPPVWRIAAEPHILLRLKRVFERVNKREIGVCTLHHSPENCRDLQWFMERYPLKISDRDKGELARGARHHLDHILSLEQIMAENHEPRAFELKVPARAYQRVAAELLLAQGHLLLADDVGLGKTASAIAACTDPRTHPIAVVTKTVLPVQWQKEFQKFAPNLNTHVIKKGTPYELPKFMGRSPDVLILNWHKLAGWGEVIARFCNFVIWDECQELRCEGSAKYNTARQISRAVKFKIGLSATPIFNYGYELYSVMQCIAPNKLGTQEEFMREWCLGKSIKDPRAFGSYLRENFLMLRRTRADVGRELPALQKIVQTVNSDTAAIDKVEDSACELAKIILAQTESYRGEKMHAAEELSNMLRQATGIAKAPFVADFIRLLIENGERPVVFGWHRAVYDIWASKLKDYRIGMFTGSESVTQKNQAKQDFIDGKLDCIFVSLRSGEGVDGWQHCCRTVVFGELDWAPGVHDQCIGRVHRDGQKDPVVAYFLVSEEGSDPLMAEVLGLKREQAEGIRDPNASLIEDLDTGTGHARRLAEAYLAKQSGAKAGAS